MRDYNNYIVDFSILVVEFFPMNTILAFFKIFKQNMNVNIKMANALSHYKPKS